MNTYSGKTDQNNSQAAANSLPKQKGDEGSIQQFADNRPEAIAQRKLREAAYNSPHVKQLRAYQAIADSRTSQTAQRKEKSGGMVQGNLQLVQRKQNNTGLPDDLKTGIENLSGISLHDVHVHRNSDKPAQLQAHAYAQGQDIHLGLGQEKHLPHEAWQGWVKATMQMKQGIMVNDDAGLEHGADVTGEKALQIRSENLDGSPPGSVTGTNNVAQLAVNWAALADKTAGDNYALSEDHSTLYSKPDVAAPEPESMYARGVDTTTEEPLVNLSTWKPNVRFLSGAVIDKNEVMREEEKGDGDSRDDSRILFDDLNREYRRIKGEVTAAMGAEAVAGASPTMGVVGRNDCAQWATALQGLIHQAREAVDPAEKVGFDLGKGEAPNMEGAPDVSSGDKMEQQLGLGSGSSHHGATVVATDGTSLVTLEAHVEKDLAAPEFHIHEGLPGFIDSNNAGPEGANMYLDSNGRKGTVTPLGNAVGMIANRTEMLSYYSGELESDDDREKLSGIQGLLRYYEEVAPPQRRRWCFLTTACVSYHNLPDDCEELTVLREFRDNYMRKLPDGNSLIEKYYEVAPGIVAKIDRSANRRDIYEELYIILRRCVEAIKKGNNSLALQVYKEMVIKLHGEYK